MDFVQTVDVYVFHFPSTAAWYNMNPSDCYYNMVTTSLLASAQVKTKAQTSINTVKEFL